MLVAVAALSLGTFFERVLLLHWALYTQYEWEFGDDPRLIRRKMMARVDAFTTARCRDSKTPTAKAEAGQ